MRSPPWAAASALVCAAVGAAARRGALSPASRSTSAFSSARWHRPAASHSSGDSRLFPIGGRRALSTTLFVVEDDIPPNESRRGLDGDESAKNESVMAPRFLALGYDAAAFLNALAGLALVWNAGKINTVATLSPKDAASGMLAAAASTRHQTNLLATYAAGALGHLFLAAATCNILSGSVRTNRLRTSGTCKRLTLGALMFGLLGLFSLPGEAGCLASSPTACGGALFLTQTAKFATAFASFAGWEYGAGGFGRARGERLGNVAREIGGGLRRAWRALPVTEERPATFYRTFFVLVTLGNLAFNVPDLLFNLRQGAGLLSLSVSLTISSVARLALLGVILFVLKDAAERKRLEGATFVKLNAAVGLWAVGVGLAQGLADGASAAFNVRRAADKLLFGALFINNGVLSQLAKMGFIRRRDEEDPDADPPLRIML